MSTPEHKEHPIVGVKVYAMVFGALVIGTILTVVAATVDMGVLNPVIALAIAVTKATLVVLFFMHIYYSSRLMKLTVISGFFIFAILMVLTMSDYISRSWTLR